MIQKPKLTKTSRDGTGRPKVYLLRYTIRIIPSRHTKLTKQGRDENHFFLTIFISVFGLIPSRKAHLSPLVDALRNRDGIFSTQMLGNPLCHTAFCMWLQPLQLHAIYTSPLLQPSIVLMCIIRLSLKGTCQCRIHLVMFGCRAAIVARAVTAMMGSLFFHWQRNALQMCETF